MNGFSKLNEAGEFKRGLEYATWLQAALPLERVPSDVVNFIGLDNEYLLHDYVKAAQAYTLLRDRYADVVSPDEMQNALKRLQAKTEQKFPKEAAESDPGAAGAWAKFLKAVRTRDEKALSAVLTAKAAGELSQLFSEGGAGTCCNNWCSATTLSLRSHRTTRVIARSWRLTFSHDSGQAPAA